MLNALKGALTLELICLPVQTWRVSKMDFPSHPSKLAPRHANEGHVPPALSSENESRSIMWSCQFVIIYAVKKKSSCSDTYRQQGKCI